MKLFKPFIRIFSLFLCFVLCFMGFVAILSQPADAFALTATAAAGLATFIEIAAIAGITFLTVDIAYRAYQAFKDHEASSYRPLDIDDEINKICRNTPGGDPPGNKWFIDSGITAGLLTLIEHIKSFFSGTGDSSIQVEDNNSSYMLLGDVRFYSYSAGSSVYPSNLQFSSSETPTIIVNGVSYLISCTRDFGFNSYRCSVNGRSVSSISHEGTPYYPSSYTCRWGMYMFQVSGELYAIPIPAFGIVDSAGVFGYSVPYIVSIPNDVTYAIPLTVPLVKPIIEIPYRSDTSFDIPSIERKIEEEQKKRGEIILDLTPTLGDINKGADSSINIDQKDMLERIGIRDGLISTGDPPRPSTIMPDIGNIWDYVKTFLGKALIWMKLWASGFVLLPQPLQVTLWALIVITIIIGVLGVFLK